MSNDSDKFHTRDQLESRGFTLEGNSFVSSAHDGDESPSPLVGSRRHRPAGEGFGARGRQRYLPLYEAKMMHQFTHRWATYQPNGRTRDMTPDELRDPTALPLPRYWVDERDVEARLEHWDRGWLLGFAILRRTTMNVTSDFCFSSRAAQATKFPSVHADYSKTNPRLKPFATVSKFVATLCI